MRLKHIYLDLALDDYEDQLTTRFGFETRYVCNFLERYLKRAKLDVDGFNAVCIRGTLNASERCTIVPEKSLRVPVKFDREAYEKLRPGEHHEFFIAMLQESAEKCFRQFSIPSEFIDRGIDDFRKGGYKNEWTHKSKLLRPAGIRASLLCRLDIERFVLTLQLERNGEVVFKEPILETKPDEICFAYKFKDVVLVDNTIVVTDTFDDPTFSLSLDTLAKPQIH